MVTAALCALWCLVSGNPTNAKAATTKAAPAVVVERERGIVMPVEVAEGASRYVGADERLRLESDVTAILQRYQAINVLSSRDVRQLADVDSKRQLSGCDSSCASEIAAAMGARYVFVPRVEVTGSGMQLTVSLVDADSARVIARGRAQGAKFADLQPQLPFAVDDAAASLRLPGDPTPADVLNEARPKLAVLPVRAPQAASPHTIAVVDAAAARVAERLSLRPLDGAAYQAIAVGRGCSVNDLGCSLPAAAAKGVALGLGISLRSEGEQLSVSAALLLPTGVAAAQATVVAAGTSEAAVDAAINAAIDAVVDNRLAGRAPAAPAKVASETSSRRMRDGDPASDEVIADFPCNIMRGIESVGARCVLGTQTLRIEPHALNIQSQREIIDLVDVKQADPYSPLAIVPSGIRLVLRDGSIRELGVGIGPRDTLLRQFRAAIR